MAGIGELLRRVTAAVSRSPHVALITDSSSQLPPDLAARFGASVVPVTVSINGIEHREGIDIDSDAFYQIVETASELPVLATTQPSAADFASAFRTAIDAGADEILAVLVGSDYSGTVNSARLAAQGVDVAVRIVDTGTASFGISCCLWAAADALTAGGDLEAAIHAVERRAQQVESVFTLQGIALAEQSGRFGRVGDDLGRTVKEAEDIAVLWTGLGAMDVFATVRTVDEAVDAMVGRITAAGLPVVAAVGRAGAQTEAITRSFRERLLAHPLVEECVEYRVGPSIAVHTGPGTAGGFFFPA